MILFIILIPFSFNTCTKSIENQVNNTISNSSNTKNSNARNSNGDTISSEQTSINLSNIDNPIRDIEAYIKNGGRLPPTKALKIGVNPNPKIPSTVETQAVTPTYPNYHCCNGICLTIPEDPYSFYAPFTDTWGNQIQFIGHYGSDIRQMYYVYLPSNLNPNSKIVVLIHGGGWTTGPNPDYVNGFVSSYTSTNTQTNTIVYNLLSQGYVVVSLLYRLSSFCNENVDLPANPVSVFDQIDDIDAAIQHIHNNFPTCLWQKGPVYANHIQVMGESAGAQLALMYAYKRAVTTYVKSVVSVAAPTNLNQYADFIKNKSNIYTPWQPTVACNTTSGSNYVLDNFNFTNQTHFPFFSVYDPNISNLIISNAINPQNFNCKVANTYRYGYTLLIQNSPTPASGPNGHVIISGSPASQNTSLRRLDLFNLAQSIVKQPITDPLNNSLLHDASPCFGLTAARNIPTFIIHGTFDELILYSQATNGMAAQLTANGGVGMYNSSNQNIFGVNGNASNPNLTSIIPTNYTAGNKHIIKTYTNSGHIYYNPISNNTQVQPDILTWLNGH